MSDMVLTLFDVEGVCVGVVLHTNNLANSHVQSGHVHCNRRYESFSSDLQILEESVIV